MYSTNEPMYIHRNSTANSQKPDGIAYFILIIIIKKSKTAANSLKITTRLNIWQILEQYCYKTDM